MTDSQGTQWETAIVNRAKARSLQADRYPKRGQKGEPDLYIGRGTHPIPAVVWKRLVGKRSGPERRKPDGVRDTATIALDDLLDLLVYAPDDYYVEVQAKWKAALNVTRTLGELRDWIGEHR